jgi:predicted dehydrogenase
VRVGLVGCGAFAHLYHVPALRADPRARLVAICDPAPGEATRRLAAGTGALLTAELGALWRDGGPEAVVVSTPHALHAGHVRAALAHGCHVLVDKPFVLRSAEARELAEVARTRGLVNAVAFNRRFDPACLRARELARQGALGATRHVETVQLGYADAGWAGDPALGGGGPFTGRGAHMADLVPWLLDRRPRAVRALVRPGPPGRVDRGGSIDLDLDGPTCHMTVLSDGLALWDEVRLFGDAGLVELRRPPGQPLGWTLLCRDARGRVQETRAADPAVGRATVDFFDAVAGGPAPACSFADAWLSVRIIEAAFASAAADGGWVDL